MNSQAVVDNSFITGKSYETPPDGELMQDKTHDQDNNYPPLLLGDFDAE